MNCRQAKTQIALWVGHDLKSADAKKLRIHVAGCDDCRAHLNHMRSSLAALHQSGAAPISDGESIWPRVSVALARTSRRKDRPSRLNRWAPPIAVAAICLAMVSIVNFGLNTDPFENAHPTNAPRTIPVGVGMPGEFFLSPDRDSEEFLTDEFDAFDRADFWMPRPVVPETERRKRQHSPRVNDEVPPGDSGGF